jgi:hypothetical protein
LAYTPTGNPNVFDVFLKVDATGYNQGSTDVLSAVALKLVSNDSSITAVSLIGNPIPTGFGGTVKTGLNANVCSGGSGGFFCSAYSNASPPPYGLQVGHAGDVYLFEWQLTLTDPSLLLLGQGAASVKALYETSGGQQHGITSEGITDSPGGIPTQQLSDVPEPSSLLLMGSGMIAAAAAVRRKVLAREFRG